ncbi:hypothetical protein [Bacillus sp. EAC]|nr:hypothetical protein [Bacillus sp. EAC]
MGNNQNPHVKKKKQNSGIPEPAAVNSEGYFAPKKSNAEALNEVKNQ